jgi:hypothetical protein
MENIPVYTIVNFNITLLCRMIQRQSPLKIRLDRIRQYDFPFGVNITYMKLFFGMIIIYMGYPVSLIHHWLFAILYLLNWYFLIYWWYYFSICHFIYCIYISVSSTLFLLCVTAYDMTEWIPLLMWSVYICYISIWYNMSYVKTNFILS